MAKKMALFLMLMFGLMAITTLAVAEATEALNKAAELLEPMALGEVFSDMSAEQINKVVAPIAKHYDFIGRISTSGRYGYILGVAKAKTPRLSGIVAPVNGYTDEIEPATPFVISSKDKKVSFPDARLVVGDTNAMKYLYIDVAQTGSALRLSLYELFRDIHRDVASRVRLKDMALRGVSPLSPLGQKYAAVVFYDGPDVRTISNAFRIEHFLLSNSDIARFRADVKAKRTYDEHININFSTTGETIKDEDGRFLPAYMSKSRPATLLKMAEEKCRYVPMPTTPKFPLVLATMELFDHTGGLRATQKIDDEEQLKSLNTCLRGSKGTDAGKCPFNAKLTLTYGDGTELVMYKACDECDLILMGSGSFRKMGGKNNVTFWKLFNEIYAQLPV